MKNKVEELSEMTADEIYDDAMRLIDSGECSLMKMERLIDDVIFQLTLTVDRLYGVPYRKHGRINKRSTTSKVRRALGYSK